MFEKTDSPELASQLSPMQFANALFESAVQRPYESLAQVAHAANFNLPPMHVLENTDRTTVAAKAGAIAGEAVDMMLISRFTKGIGTKAFGEIATHNSALKAGAHLGLTGGVYSGIFTPVNDERDQLKERLKNALTDGLSFAAMGATANGLARTKMFETKSFETGVAVNALAGAVGGTIDAQSRSLLNGRGVASFSETKTESINFAAFGAMFAGAGGALDSALARAVQHAESPRLTPEKQNAVGDGLTVGKLEAAFGEPLVRVRLRWDLLKQLDSPVSSHVIVDHEALSNLYHPWFNDTKGQIVGWDSADAQPLSVKDVAEKQATITPQRDQNIQKTATLLSTFDDPVQITALGYELPDGKHFLLDSNHRIAAVAAARLPFRLILHSINGPVKGQYLPDLVQFDRDASGSANARAQAIQKVKDQNGWN